MFRASGNPVAEQVFPNGSQVVKVQNIVPPLMTDSTSMFIVPFPPPSSACWVPALLHPVLQWCAELC